MIINDSNTITAFPRQKRDDSDLVSQEYVYANEGVVNQKKNHFDIHSPRKKVKKEKCGES